MEAARSFHLTPNATVLTKMPISHTNFELLTIASDGCFYLLKWRSNEWRLMYEPKISKSGSPWEQTVFDYWLSSFISICPPLLEIWNSATFFFLCISSVQAKVKAGRAPQPETAHFFSGMNDKLHLITNQMWFNPVDIICRSCCYW